MKSKIFNIILFLCCTTFCLGNYLTLKNAEGVSLEARILTKSEENVTFERIDGVVFTTLISRLSEDSQRLINNWNPIDFTLTFENNWGEDIKQGVSPSNNSELEEYKLKIKSSSGEEMKFSKKELDVFPDFLATVRTKIKRLSNENVPNGFSFVVPMPKESSGLKWTVTLEGNEWRLYMPNYFNQTAGMSIFEVFTPSKKYLKESTYLYWKDYLDKLDFDKELRRYAELREKVK
jgi:hypothetical protein